LQCGPISKRNALRFDSDNRLLVGQYIEVVEYPDGTIESQADGVSLPYKEYDRITSIDQGAEVENKRLSAALTVARIMQEQRDDRRTSNSPSRTHIGEQVNAKKALVGLKKQRAMTVEDFNAAENQVTQKALQERGAAAPPHPKTVKRSNAKAKQTTRHF
jgi:hypothetical protein